MRCSDSSRRHFLKTLGVLSLSSALPVSRLVRAETLGLVERTLIVVHLDGGCDGINTVIPFTDPAYYLLRPTLSIPAESVLPISESLALHPAMSAMKAWFDQGKVAIVNGVGYPDFTFSHFSAEDVYWLASPEGSPPATGWLGRALDALPDTSPLSGVSLESRTPKSMTAKQFTAPAIPDIGRYHFQTPANPFESAAQLASADAIFMQGPGGQTMFDGLLAADLAALESIDQVQAAVTAYTSPIEYPSDAFGQALKLAGQLVKAGTGTRVLTTSLGGFDTHANQNDTLDNLLDKFSRGIDAFMKDAVAGGFADRVAILVWTEFGRRVAENASGGTDHGSAAPMWLIGQSVQGGILGEYQNLSDLENGNLKMQQDFRSVYATVLADWLGFDDVALLGLAWPRLPLFA